MKQYILTFIVGLSALSFLQGQNLPDYRWENRVLMVLAGQENNPILNRQLAEWGTAWEELEERRLKVLVVTPWEVLEWTPDGYVGEPESSNWYNLYRRTHAPVEILLFGLDGGLKGQQQNFLINQDLFILIDQMPMRIREMTSEASPND
ncbi:MAG: DUF4174 domain-containing protein [Bacteroidota bacterium]